MTTVKQLTQKVKDELAKMYPEYEHEIAYVTAGHDLETQCITWIKAMKLSGWRPKSTQEYEDLIATVILEYVDRLHDGMIANADSLAKF